MISKKIITVFSAALSLRLLVFFLVMDDPRVFVQPDSHQYIRLAEGLIDFHSFCQPETGCRPDVERMPGYPLFLSVLMAPSNENFLVPVVIQIMLDAFSCVLIFRMGQMVFQGAGLMSGLLAAAHLGMVTYCHFILTDSLFLFVLIWGIILSLALLSRPRILLFAALGLVLGTATLIRPLALFLPFLLSPLLFFHTTMKIKAGTGRMALGVMVLLTVHSAVIFPWMARNHRHYGRFRLHSQTGGHLLGYVVPFVWQYSDGIPFLKGKEKAEALAAEKIHHAGSAAVLTPFEVSDIETKIAVDILKTLPPAAIVKAWASGMAKNLGAPSLVDFSHLLKIKRPRFFATPGATLLEQTRRFILDSGSFGKLLVLNMALTIIFRIFQLLGLIRLCRERKFTTMTLMLLIIAYFLVISGPVGYAKYRLPFEPALIVLAAIGIKSLYKPLSIGNISMT